jgi:hypothetical protein
MTIDNSGLVADALLRTDPALYKSIDGANSWKTAVCTRGARVAKYRRYEEGDHDANITTQMRNMLRLREDSSDLDEFSINYMAIIIDKMASRLKVSEVTTDDEVQDEYISHLLELNDWDALQGVYYRGAIRDGDSYAMVDPLTLKWTTEPAYDGFSGIVAIFQKSSNYPVWACKLWSEADNADISEDDVSYSTTMKIKVYQRYKITNFQGGVGGQSVEPLNGVETDQGVDITTNVQAFALEIVPVIHFSNLVDNYTQYGKSELRKAIPIQNVLNRTLYSMVMASEFAAFKVAWSIGLELDKSGIMPGDVLNLVLVDSTGKVIIPSTLEEIEFLKAVRVGEFDATDISQYTNQLAEIVKHISQVTQTPIYGVTAEGNLSGEALKQLEIGLIGKIKRFQNENTAAVRQLIELTAMIQKAYDTGEGQPPELEGISVNWQSPEILDTSAAVTSIVTVREKAPGLFSDDFFRQRLGAAWNMTQSQISAEGKSADENNSISFNKITGAGGEVPLV